MTDVSESYFRVGVLLRKVVLGTKRREKVRKRSREGRSGEQQRWRWETDVTTGKRKEYLSDDEPKVV